MRRRILSMLFLSAVVLWNFTSVQLITHPTTASHENIPAPEDVLGFRPGDDRKLASWNQVIEYFERLDRSSDRLLFETLGQTTMDKPFVMATISAPENLARLEEYKAIQEQLADPRKLGSIAARDAKAARLIANSKTIVLITCGIHSTEVGSYLSSMIIAHRLASSNEPEIQNILHNTIILLVPSLNPDGVDIVKNWYDKTLGTPYEGTDPPELYHKYVGHDNNRDWYAFTQVETQITVDRIHNAWHPQIVHDIHQQGAMGSRLFLPPYMAPVEPNVPKQIVQGYTELGNWMAREMRAKGFQGITTNSTYDAWSPSRAYSHYHGGVRILSETASAKIATPLTLKFEELTSREGYDPKKESENFGPLWRGGEWKLRDITNTMTTAAFLLLRHAAENRRQWLQRFYSIGKDAVRPRRPGEPFAFVIPGANYARETLYANEAGRQRLLQRERERTPRDPSSQMRERLIRVLINAGLEVEQVTNVLVPGVTKQDSVMMVRLDQPYAAFAMALLQKQEYPNLRDQRGQPQPPYDATAHTLPLLMGVKVILVNAPFNYHHEVKYMGFVVDGEKDYPTNLAIYRSNVPAMDEGWTRWILEHVPLEMAPRTNDSAGNEGSLRIAFLSPGSLGFASLSDNEIRSGGLFERHKTIIIPDQAAGTILNGHRAGAMPPELTGGLGTEGVRALREYVENGGTLVCLNRASEFAIEQFKLPIRNIVAGLPRTEFYVPGSILRIELDTKHPIARSMPKESIAWAEESPVFEVLTSSTATSYSVPISAVKIIGWYPQHKDPLLSGWLLGGNRIRGKAALLEVKMGKGRIVLFGFRPQYRAQSLATYPLFFNALSLEN